MEDKSFYLSDLALEMLVLSQITSEIPLPTSGISKEASQQEMLKEIYSLVSNGIMENDEKNNRFAVNKELVPLLKTILSSKTVFRVTNMRFSRRSFFCYLSGNNVTVVERTNARSNLKLSGITADTFNEMLFSKLDITENLENVSTDVEVLETGDDVFPAEMVSMSIEDLKNGFGDAEGCVDIFLCKNLTTVCRIMIFKKLSEYNIAVMTEKKILICDYTFVNFCKAIERITGED